MDTRSLPLMKKRLSIANFVPAARRTRSENELIRSHVDA
jgi:hypothetical protein